MRIVKQIDPKTRVVLKLYLPALATAICLQRKRWYGWKTVSWNYPSVAEKYHNNWDDVIDYLLWSESKYHKSRGLPNELAIGEEMIKRFK